MGISLLESLYVHTITYYALSMHSREWNKKILEHPKAEDLNVDVPKNRVQKISIFDKNIEL